MTTFTEAERGRLAKQGVALPDGSFTVRNREELDHAIRVIGLADDPNAAKQHVIKRARAIGAKGALPVSWL